MNRVRRVGSFLFAGAVGFAVDLAVFTIVHWISATPWLSRVSASLVAIVATWLLNRRFTFERVGFEQAGREFFKYLLASLLGASANFLAFSLIYHFTTSIPVAYVGGTMAGLIINFSGYSRFVFPER